MNIKTSEIKYLTKYTTDDKIILEDYLKNHITLKKLVYLFFMNIYLPTHDFFSKLRLQNVGT